MSREASTAARFDSLEQEVFLNLWRHPERYDGVAVMGRDDLPSSERRAHVAADEARRADQENAVAHARYSAR